MHEQIRDSIVDSKSQKQSQVTKQQLLEAKGNFDHNFWLVEDTFFI